MNKTLAVPVQLVLVIYLAVGLLSKVYAECEPISLKAYQFLNHSCKLFEVHREDSGQTIIVTKAGSNKTQRLDCSEAKRQDDGTYGIFSKLTGETFYCGHHLGDPSDGVQTSNDRTRND